MAICPRPGGLAGLFTVASWLVAAIGPALGALAVKNAGLARPIGSDATARISPVETRLTWNSGLPALGALIGTWKLMTLGSTRKIGAGMPPNDTCTSERGKGNGSPSAHAAVTANSLP